LGALISKIVSGGQTGVDRAALDVALDLGLACGGWAPRGRRAEDGRIPARYPMRETATAAYPQRTRLNVRDADATLILTRGEPAGGTAFTIACAERIGRPWMLVDLASPDLDHLVAAVREWLLHQSARVLNVAGPRESSAPGIAAEAAAFLRSVLEDEAPAR
jgi:hypothetical protein